MATLRKRSPTRRGPGLQVLIVGFFALAYFCLAAYSGSLQPLRLVKGTSMQPTLRAGDVALIKSIAILDLKVGDIVVFSTPQPLKGGSTPGAILHRVLRIQARDSGPVLVTKGDNAPVDAFPVPASALQGKMVARIPLVGWPFVFLTSSKGILFLSVTVLLALLYIPAMAIFYTSVLKRPESGLREGAGPGQAVIESVKVLATEQGQLRSSLLGFGEAIAQYATHLQSHTAVVQNLAGVSDQLKNTNQLLNDTVGFHIRTLERWTEQAGTPTQVAAEVPTNGHHAQKPIATEKAPSANGEAAAASARLRRPQGVGPVALMGDTPRKNGTHAEKPAARVKAPSANGEARTASARSRRTQRVGPVALMGDTPTDKASRNGIHA